MQDGVPQGAGLGTTAFAQLKFQRFSITLWLLEQYFWGGGIVHYRPLWHTPSVGP